MGAQVIKVLVACGSGVATSTVAEGIVQEIAKSEGIPIQLFKGTISEVPHKQDDVDVVLTTANYRNPLKKPYMSVFPLISGINKAKCASQLVELLKSVQSSKK
ncbi:PTS sugar transporter subunit IIB [Olsenella sp. HMSC062G07]|uniref:PTS sugar transporter subunit IIB n=1 Tax=Olsenella sp. HMSC062G07 TaxID=1739330 RepID=UPI0008A36EDE|nr:PTS sugar transporter subunit IIB [Olsenella sp. HMSC062G07]OFK23419.1 PTS galactitol transporter subunit IIB [Olsenella sp. HMSC062G07]